MATIVWSLGIVCRPIQFGGLGILDLATLGWALRIRWLWLCKTEPSRPWVGFKVQVPHIVSALFDIAIETIVGDGTSTLFWTDKWLQGRSISDLAHNMSPLAPQCVLKLRTVCQALDHRRWVSNIKGALSVSALVEYPQLWELLELVILQHGVSDQHIWRLSGSSIYSSKLVYNSFFIGSTSFTP